MEFGLKSGNLGEEHAGCIVAGVFEGGKLSPTCRIAR